jgi:hypothetical protein
MYKNPGIKTTPVLIVYENILGYINPVIFQIYLS